MSVVGLDVGNENCIVAVARLRGIDVVLNDESKRETPAIVSFNDKQRFIGTAASASLTMYPKNTVSQIKRLLGRRFNDPEVQQDLGLLPFKVTEGPDGGPLIHVKYLGESRSFTPSQILGMILSNLRSIAEKNLQTHVSDCVIGIPVFFTEVQRRAMLDAAAIAGLRPLRLMHETAATALAYGIYKTDLPDSDPINVVFVDVGHAAMQICVVAFKKGQLKVLAHAFDQNLGGRDFDEVLFNHFCGKFKEEYRIDVLSNSRACQRLRSACEKMKKVLSANPEAPLNIECLMDEKDVRGYMKRDDFEKLAQPLLERVKALCDRAFAEANISTEKIYAVEVVGSGSRVPAVLKILANVFEKEPSRTMNASECIARGCALQCAMFIVECNKAEEWLKEKKSQQDHIPRSGNPVLLSADVKKKAEALDRFCKPIMTKAPPQKPASPPQAKGASNKESETTVNESSADGGHSQSSEPMDADSLNVEGERMQTD